MDIRKRILKVICSFIDDEFNEQQILNLNFKQEKIFNSLTFIHLIVSLEEEFGVEIDTKYLLIDNMSSFNEIFELIKHLLNEKNLNQRNNLGGE